jgi:hypothetical protein
MRRLRPFGVTNDSSSTLLLIGGRVYVGSNARSDRDDHAWCKKLHTASVVREIKRNRHRVQAFCGTAAPT